MSSLQRFNQTSLLDAKKVMVDDLLVFKNISGLSNQNGESQKTSQINSVYTKKFASSNLSDFYSYNYQNIRGYN